MYIPFDRFQIHLPMQETQETWDLCLDQEDPLEKEMATHSSIHAWTIPWTIPEGQSNAMDSSAWRARVQRLAKSWIELSTLTQPFQIMLLSHEIDST